MILSQTVEAGTALQILAERPEGLGYLLKDRVTDIEDFAGTLRRVAAGGCALDPQVVTQLLAAPADGGRMATLTPREREVLALVAEGRSNKGAADRLGVTERAVQKHVTSIFDKLGLPAGEDDNRRILAVLHVPAPGCAPAGVAVPEPPDASRRPIAARPRLGPSTGPRNPGENPHASTLSPPSPRPPPSSPRATSSAATATATPPSTPCAASRSTSPKAA